MSHEMITYLLGAVVLIALGVIYYCNKQQGNPKMQTLSLIMLLVAVASGGYMIYHMIWGNNEEEALHQQSEILYASEGFKLGKMISEANAGGNVVVLMEQAAADRAQNDKESREALFIEAMQKAAPDLTVDIAVPQVPDLPDEFRASTSFAQQVTADDFNKALNGKNPTAIVFACKFPVNFTTSESRSYDPNAIVPDKFKCLRKNSADKLPVYLTSSALNSKYAGDMLGEKRIAAAIKKGGNGKTDGISTDDYDAAFAAGYQLVEPRTAKRR